MSQLPSAVAPSQAGPVQPAAIQNPPRTWWWLAIIFGAFLVTGIVLLVTNPPPHRLPGQPPPPTEGEQAIGPLLLTTGMIGAWILPVVWGIKWARYKGLSANWMWFGAHPLGGWIAWAVIRFAAKRHVCPQCGRTVRKSQPLCFQCAAGTERAQPAPLASSAPPPLPAGAQAPPAPPSAAMPGALSSAWYRAFWNLLEQSIQEHVGPDERLCGFIAVGKGNIALAIVLVVLLMPIVLLLSVVLTPVGLVWITYLFFANWGRLSRAGANMGTQTAQLILVWLFPIAAGMSLAVVNVLFPLLGMRVAILARTGNHILLVPYWPYFSMPILRQPRPYSPGQIALQGEGGFADRPEAIRVQAEGKSTRYRLLWNPRCSPAEQQANGRAVLRA